MDVAEEIQSNEENWTLLACEPQEFLTFCCCCDDVFLGQGY